MYFSSESTPLLIDYACHYSPRKGSAAIHNRPHPGGLTPISVGMPLAFAASDAADVFVAEERSGRFHTAPAAPHEMVVPTWDYPEKRAEPDSLWRFRRYAMLVKHEPGPRALPDYLVLRDGIESPMEDVWQNFHVLARSVERVDAHTFRFVGQLDQDLTLAVFGPDLLETRSQEWGWSGNSHQRRSAKFDTYEREYFGRWIPEDFEPGGWKGADSGERAVWLRLRAARGESDWMLVVVPHRKGTPPPRIERLSDNRVRVSRGETVEIVRIGDGASVERDGKTTVLLEPGEVEERAEETDFNPYPDLMPWQY